MRIIIVGKDKPIFTQAIQFLRKFKIDLSIYTGKLGEPFPQDQDAWRCDYLISFLSPWIINNEILNSAKLAAINFHPGPPEYPGTGCTNFALYEGASRYGVTAHIMLPEVDTGEIIAVRRFEIFQNDTVATLLERSYENLLLLFQQVITDLLNQKKKQITNEQWKRKPFRRKQLDELCRITFEMSSEEIQKRIRATTYPGYPGPYVELHGFIFELRK